MSARGAEWATATRRRGRSTSSLTVPMPVPLPRLKDPVYGMGAEAVDAAVDATVQNCNGGDR